MDGSCVLKVVKIGNFDVIARTVMISWWKVHMCTKAGDLRLCVQQHQLPMLAHIEAMNGLVTFLVNCM